MDLYLSRVVSLANHLQIKGKTNRLLSKVCIHESERLLRASVELKRAICGAEAIGLPENLATRIKARLKAGHVEAWLEKPTHGYLHREVKRKSSGSNPASNAWNLPPFMSSHLEGYLCALQEQEIETRFLKHQRATNPSQVNPTCRHCQSSIEDITHIMGSCPRLSASLYLPMRHNEVAKSVYNTIIRTIDPCHEFVSPRPIFQVGPLEIWWDTKIRTTPRVECDKPDIVVWNRQSRTCAIVEVGVPLDINVTKIEEEKRNKYMPLAVTLLRLYPDYQFSTISVVVGATGFITSSIFEAIRKLGVPDKHVKAAVAQLRYRAVSGTIKVVKSALALKK
jgi:hypothetical protein